MSTINSVECRSIPRVHMKLIRAKGNEGVRFYNATGASQEEIVQIIKAAISGRETKDEITNEKHKEECAKWWEEAGHYTSAESKP